MSVSELARELFHDASTIKGTSGILHEPTYDEHGKIDRYKFSFVSGKPVEDPVTGIAAYPSIELYRSGGVLYKAGEQEIVLSHRGGIAAYNGYVEITGICNGKFVRLRVSKKDGAPEIKPITPV